MSTKYQGITHQTIRGMTPSQRFGYRLYEYVDAVIEGFKWAAFFIGMTNSFISDAIAESYPENHHKAQDTLRQLVPCNNAQKATEPHLRKYGRG